MAVGLFGATSRRWHTLDVSQDSIAQLYRFGAVPRVEELRRLGGKFRQHDLLHLKSGDSVAQS